MTEVKVKGAVKKYDDEDILTIKAELKKCDYEDIDAIILKVELDDADVYLMYNYSEGTIVVILKDDDKNIREILSATARTYSIEIPTSFIEKTIEELEI